MARPGPATRGGWRRLADGAVLSGHAPRSPASGKAQRASAAGVFLDAGVRGGGGIFRARDLEAGAAGTADLAAGRVRLGALLALPDHGGAGGAGLRARVHGLRGRSLFAA